MMVTKIDQSAECTQAMLYDLPTISLWIFHDHVSAIGGVDAITFTKIVFSLIYYMYMNFVFVYICHVHAGCWPFFASTEHVICVHHSLINVYHLLSQIFVKIVLKMYLILLCLLDSPYNAYPFQRLQKSIFAYFYAL